MTIKNLKNHFGGILVLPLILITACATSAIEESAASIKPQPYGVRDSAVIDASVAKHGIVKPLIFMPPAMPTQFMQNNFSGHCVVTFDILQTGKIKNPLATYYTDVSLKLPSETAVSKWFYSPKIVNGERVGLSDVAVKVRYVIQNARGETYPEP